MTTHELCGQVDKSLHHVGASRSPFLNGEDALPSIAMHIPKKNESIYPRRKLCTQIFVHSPKAEAMQMSTD